MVRRTMGKEKAVMGRFILEQEPSDKMAETAERKGNFNVISYKKDLPPNHYPKLQILTAQEILDEKIFSTLSTLLGIRAYRKGKTLF